MNRIIFWILIMLSIMISCKQKSETTFWFKNESRLLNKNDSSCYINEFLDSSNNCREVIYYFKKEPILIQIFNNQNKLISEYSDIYIDTILKIDRSFDTLSPVYFCIQFNKSQYYSNGMLKSKFIKNRNQIEYLLKYDSLNNKITVDTIDMKSKIEYSNELRRFLNSNK